MELRFQEMKYPYGVDMHFTRQGNFTICILTRHRTRELIGFGAAKRNVIDMDVPEYGRGLALDRALAMCEKETLIRCAIDHAEYTVDRFNHIKDWVDEAMKSIQ